MPISHIDNLDPDERRYALQMFAELADNQRGYPERMGGALSYSYNPGLNHAQGIYTHLTEHVGDLTHRMAQRHCDDHGYFYFECKRKIDMALRELQSNFEHGVESQLKSAYDYAEKNGQKVPKWDDWVEQWKASGREYAKAHAALTVWNRAQFAAREAAVALGLHDWEECQHQLTVLASLSKTPELWEKYAGEVWLNDQGAVMPVSENSKNRMLKEGADDEELWTKALNAIQRDTFSTDPETERKADRAMRKWGDRSLSQQEVEWWAYREDEWKMLHDDQPPTKTKLSQEPIRIRLKPKDPNLELRLKEFMADLWQHTHPHPFMRGARLTQNAAIEATIFDGSIRIQSVQTMEPRSGGGTEAMNLLCALADRHQVPMTLTAKKFGTDKEYMSTARLEKWYTKFGFRKQRGDARDGYDMRREPLTPTE